MAYKIIETSLALQDLDNILGYIAVSLASPKAASDFADRVEKCYSNLERTPLMYELCRDPHLRLMGYRKAVLKHYIMIYKIEEGSKTVAVMRFFHGRQDYEKLL